MPFDPFRRFRLRSHPISARSPSSEEDTDESSLERSRSPILHVPAHKGARKSGDRLHAVPDNGKQLPQRLTQGALIALTLDEAPHPERPPNKSSKPGVASVASPTSPAANEALKPSLKPTLIRRVTSKLNISIPTRSETGLRSWPSTRTLPGDMKPPATQGPRPPRATIAVSPTLPNGFVSKQHREAALRERGLLPPCKDLSEQEREADQHLGCVPSPADLTVDGPTEAEQLKASWLAINRTSDSSVSDRAPPAPPHLHGTRSPSSPPDPGVPRRSGDVKTDHPPAGRPSCCSSVPPLSTSSFLEVLHEEPLEQGPITPPPPLSPVPLSIIVSGPLDSQPSPTLVQSPVSYTFSSHCPGSTLESVSQSSHPPPVFEKDILRSTPSRRRTSDSGDQPRKAVGSSLSKLGTRSLSNLRRSLAESLKAPSSSTLSSGDLSSSSISQAPRKATEPTMHDLGSIIRETKNIQDPETRRLCELAFLD